MDTDLNCFEGGPNVRDANLSVFIRVPVSLYDLYFGWSLKAPSR